MAVWRLSNRTIENKVSCCSQVGSAKDKDQKVPGDAYTNIHIKDKDLAGTMYMTW